MSGFMGTPDFSFVSMLNIRFGTNQIAHLPNEIRTLGAKRAFIVADPGIVQAKLLDKPLESLRQAGITADVFADVEANPRDTTIDTGCNRLKNFDADVVVGFGGGSALDTAKGIALLTTNGGSICDYDGVDKVHTDPIPIIAIPTTAGTGSEVTANAAITNTRSHYKMSVRSPRIIPCRAIVDPTLLASLPRFIAATSGIDALVHAIEGFLSIRSSVISDVFAREAVRLLAANLRPFVANPRNLQAASAMHLGSLLAGVVISNTGTGNDHAIARALGGVCDVAHGLATAILLPPVLAFNAQARPDKMVLIAEDLGLPMMGTPSEVARRVVTEAESLLVDLGVPGSLTEIGIQRDVIPDLVDVAIGNVGPNPRRTTRDELRQLIEAAF